MNTDNLIEIIAEEVLKRIGMVSLQHPKEKKRNILIIDSRDRQKNGDYEGIVSKSRDVKFLDDYCQEYGAASFDYIIVPKLSNKDLVSIAVGDSRSEVSEIIVDGIFRGKKIIVLEDGIAYRKFKDTANQDFFNMFKEYEKRITGFGVEFVKREDLAAYLDDNSFKAKEHSQSKGDISKGLGKEKSVEEASIIKKVASERDIERLWNRGFSTIRIDKKTIITPLAKDFIRTNDINIKL